MLKDKPLTNCGFLLNIKNSGNQKFIPKKNQIIKLNPGNNLFLNTIIIQDRLGFGSSLIFLRLIFKPFLFSSSG